MAYPNLYAALSRRLTEEGRAQADALLGLPGAEERVAELRHDAVTTAGFEVG